VNSMRAFVAIDYKILSVAHIYMCSLVLQ
jgi:hypothetical protein